MFTFVIMGNKVLSTGSGRLNVGRSLKQTYQIVSFERTRHMIGFVDNPSQDLFDQTPQQKKEAAKKRKEQPTKKWCLHLPVTHHTPYPSTQSIICYHLSNPTFNTTMDGDQEDRKPLNKGKGKERAQSLPENAGEDSITPPTERSNSSPNQSVSNSQSSTSGPRLSRSPASQVREELEGGRRRSLALAPGSPTGPNEGTLRRMNFLPCSPIARR
jgi:hypothetical protein